LEEVTELPAPEGTLPRPLRLFLYVTTGLTLLCAAVELWCSRVLHLAYPYTWPLMPRDDPFLDFALYEDRFALFHSRAFFTYTGPDYYYPAPMAVAHQLFFSFPDSTDVYLIFLAAAFLVGLFLVGKSLVGRGVALRSVAPFLLAVAACSYPFWFDFEQANVEWIVCVLVVAGIWTFLRGRGYSAAVCFGLAGSMKIYPFLFVALLISRRQYRQAAAAAGVCAMSTIVSLWLVCPDMAVSWRGTQDGLTKFKQWYMLRFEQVGFDHSLFAIFKAAWLAHSSTLLSEKTLAVMLGLYVSAMAFAGIILYFDRIRRLPIVNQVICLSVLSILLPPVSYDYTLLHMYAPWALLVFLAVEAKERRVAGLGGALVCFAILFAPETEFIYRQRSFGGQIKAVTLIALLAIALRRRFPSAYDTEPLLPA